MLRSKWTALLKFEKLLAHPPSSTNVCNQFLLNKVHSSSSTADQRLCELQYCLMKHGIPEEYCATIAANVQMNSTDLSQIDHTLSSWSALQLGGDRLTNLLVNHPNLLLLDQERIFSTHSFLSTMFTQHYVYKIIKNSPHVFTLKESEISRRLDFLMKEINARNADLVNSQALSHPLSHLRTRYAFLLRCGAFKKVTDRSDERQYSQNPQFAQIFDTDDETFAYRVARLSPLEYQTFVNLYQQEIEDEEEFDSDDEE